MVTIEAMHLAIAPALNLHEKISLMKQRINVMSNEDSSPIYRSVDISLLQWPSHISDEEEDDNERNVTMGWINRDYIDLGEISWGDVKEAVDYENELISQIDINNRQINYNDVIDYDDTGALFGLDLGVASSVLALLAAGCITISSCNGSSGHTENYPVVIFRSRPNWVYFLLEVAEKTECGLDNAEAGTIVLFANDVHSIIQFAQELVSRHPEFDELQASNMPEDHSTGAQLGFNGL